MFRAREFWEQTGATAGTVREDDIIVRVEGGERKKCALVDCGRIGEKDRKPGCESEERVDMDDVGRSGQGEWGCRRTVAEKSGARAGGYFRIDEEKFGETVDDDAVDEIETSCEEKEVSKGHYIFFEDAGNVGGEGRGAGARAAESGEDAVMEEIGKGNSEKCV